MNGTPEKQEFFGHPKFYRIIDSLKQLHSNKNRDYATKENPLGNFLRVAEWCKTYNLVTRGNEATKVAMIFKLKQLDAALKLLGSGQKGKVEGIPGRLNDDATYSIIARILYEEANMKKDEVCIFCGFNLSDYERRCKQKGKKPSSRRWAGGFNFQQGFICGSCGDELKWRLQE